MINAIHEWIVNRREVAERQREHSALIDELEELSYHADRALSPEAYLAFAIRIEECLERVAVLQPAVAPIPCRRDRHGQVPRQRDRR